MYDWFPSLTPESEALDAFCLLESELCENFLSEIMDPVINNIPRYEMGAAAFPAGQSYRAMVYYAQSIRGDYKFSLYDYGTMANMKIYGSKDPPAVPLENFDLPTVF